MNGVGVGVAGGGGNPLPKNVGRDCASSIDELSALYEVSSNEFGKYYGWQTLVRFYF